VTRLLAIWRAHPWISGAFLAALALTLFFGTRMVLFTIYWSDPAHRDQALQGWMTPGYVAQSWDVPREALARALGPLAEPGKRMTLDRIAAENDVPLDQVIARLEAAIAAARAGE
jgi:hypothetical protein